MKALLALILAVLLIPFLPGILLAVLLVIGTVVEHWFLSLAFFLAVLGGLTYSDKLSRWLAWFLDK
jgi:hypothetical protein